MKLATAAMTLLLGGVTLFGACKKADDVKNTITGSGDLKAGQCTISFDTDKDFNGTTSISIPASATTTANRSGSGTTEQLTLVATSVNTSTFKATTAQLVIEVNKGATTSGGNISVPFNGGGTNNFAVITVSNTSAGQSTPAYSSESGTVTITKLSATDIEGTFTSHAVNESENTSINLTNGKFAGKFK